MKQVLQTLSILFSILLIFQMSAQASNILMGSIKFPDDVKEVPLIPIWAGGFLLKREIDQRAKEISFQVPRYQSQQAFYLIVTQAVYPIKVDAAAATNNVAYLRVPEHQSYKLFYLELRTKSRDDEAKKEFFWFIEEHLLQEPDRRIPDNAIILLYRPDAIAQVKGGSNFELPTIKIQDNLLELFGSEQLLAEDAARCAIASISVNTFHSIIPQTIKVDKGRTLVAPIT